MAIRGRLVAEVPRYRETPQMGRLVWKEAGEWRAVLHPTDRF